MSLFLSATLRFGVNEWVKPAKFCLAHRPVENPSVPVYQSLGYPSLRATTFLEDKLCNTQFNRVAIGTTKALSETEEQLVVYRCLSDGNSLWVRPLLMFLETVKVAGQDVPRFARTDQDD